MLRSVSLTTVHGFGTAFDITITNEPATTLGPTPAPEPVLAPHTAVEDLISELVPVPADRIAPEPLPSHQPEPELADDVLCCATPACAASMPVDCAVSASSRISHQKCMRTNCGVMMSARCIR